MPLKIVRNDITKMNTEAIVNTASSKQMVGTGCDCAIYQAAGYDNLLTYRTQNIGEVPEGEAFITPGFNLEAKYIIHTVSPLYVDGESGEEEKLRLCYRNSLNLALENKISSISFPLIATGSFGYPMADGLRIALDEINAFLLENEMDVTIVVFGTRATEMAANVYPKLQSYIDHHYVKRKREEEYDDAYFGSYRPGEPGYDAYSARAYRVDAMSAAQPKPAMSVAQPKPAVSAAQPKPAMSAAQSKPAMSAARPKPAMSAAQPLTDVPQKSSAIGKLGSIFKSNSTKNKKAEEANDKTIAPMMKPYHDSVCMAPNSYIGSPQPAAALYDECDEFDEDWDDLEAFPGENKLKERVKNLSRPFGEYFFYLVEQKGMSSTDVQNGAWISKQVYHKINKNRTTYHPDKRTAMQLCVGLRLSLDESKDFLRMAGYTFSPSDLEDIIFSFFLSMNPDEYDIMDVSDALEEYELKPIVVLKSNSVKGA